MCTLHEELFSITNVLKFYIMSGFICNPITARWNIFTMLMQCEPFEDVAILHSTCKQLHAYMHVPYCHTVSSYCTVASICIFKFLKTDWLFSSTQLTTIATLWYHGSTCTVYTVPYILWNALVHGMDFCTGFSLLIVVCHCCNTVHLSETIKNVCKY